MTSEPSGALIRPFTTDTDGGTEADGAHGVRARAATDVINKDLAG